MILKTKNLSITAIFCLSSFITTQIIAQNDPIVKKGEIVTIVTADNRGRLCPIVHCGQDKHLLRFPTNTKLKVESSKKTSNRLFDVIWYKVTYKGKTGWVSEFDTDMAPEGPRYR